MVIISNHFNMQPNFAKDLAAWHAAGKIKWRQTVLRGIEKAPEAFLGLFKGQNIGKMLVKLKIICSGAELNASGEGSTP